LGGGERVRVELFSHKRSIRHWEEKRQEFQQRRGRPKNKSAENKRGGEAKERQKGGKKKEIRKPSGRIHLYPVLIKPG